jgi:hypothetical protein
MTHTMLWEKGCRGEMLRLYFKLWPKCRPTDSLLQQCDYDIKYMSSGGRGSPMLDFTQGVVDPRDGHLKCPRGSRSP